MRAVRALGSCGLRTLAVVGLWGCSIRGIDYTQKDCPCPAAYVCNTATNKCTLDDRTGVDAAPSDTSVAIDADPATTLQYWFKLDETAGNLVHNEIMGQPTGYAKNVANLTWVPGRHGNALHFDGTAYASYVAFPSGNGVCTSPPSYTSSITVATWAQFDSFQPWLGYSLGDVIAMQGSSGGNGGGWGVGATDACGATTAAITVTAPGRAARTTLCGQTALVTGRWYYIVGVYDATVPSLELYIDGVRDSGTLAPNSPALTTSLNAATGCPYLGASANQSRLLHGAIDDLRFYTRALDADEVLALYANPS